jgi:hypothetical protein
MLAETRCQMKAAGRHPIHTAIGQATIFSRTVF